MRVEARVQHHPARASLLPALLRDLDPLPTEVVTDPEPDAIRSPWRTYLNCLAEPPDCTHLLIVQDDAQPCPGFPAAVTAVADANPDTPVCLFVSKQANYTRRGYLDAIRSGDRYAPIHPRDFVPVVAVLWPRHVAEQFRTWALANPHATNRNPRSDDAMAGKWMRTTRQTFLATVPSLVEHMDEVPSLIRPYLPAKQRGRRAIDYASDREIAW